MAATQLRTIKKATLSLGLVTLMLEVVGAVDEDKTDLVNACEHKADDEHRGSAPARIKRKEFCPRCLTDETHSWSKGGMVGKDYIALVDPTALEKILASTKDEAGPITVMVHDTAALSETFYSGKAYYLRPQKGTSAEGYTVFAHVIEAHPEWAILGEFSFGGMPSLYRFGVMSQFEGGPVLVMRQLARPDLVRQAPVVVGELNKGLVPMAETLLASMVTPFSPTGYANKQVAAIRELVTAATPVALWNPDSADAPVGAQLSLADQLAASIAANSPAPATAAKPTRRRAAKKVAEPVPLAS